MLDETMTFEKKEGQDYPPIPKGIYQVELLEIKANQNETYDSKMGKTAEKQYQTDLSYQFVLLTGQDKNGTLRGRNIWENFGHTFLYIGKNGKNNLYRIVEAFLKRELTKEEEANGISAKLLNSFIGKQVMIAVEPKTNKQGKTFDRITDYFAANADLTPLTAEEKEKARVKKDEEAEKFKQVADEINREEEEAMNEAIENIPFN
jgi:hypothetical protein